jgi:hypothetical protein
MAGFKAPQGGQKFTPQKNILPGTYPGRLVQLIDYGLQPQKPYKGEEKKPINEIGLTYELVDEFMKDEQGNDIPDKPRWISETIPFHPLIAEKAKSTQRYNAFDPNGVYDGDFSKALGQPINVTIVNNKSGDKVYDNVATLSTMRPKDAEACAPLVNPPTMFSLDEPDLAVFNKFPEWIRNKIKGNLNFNGSKLQAALGGKAEAVDKGQEAVAEANGDAGNNNPY